MPEIYPAPVDHVPAAEPADLAAMPFWQARSFWLTVLALVAAVAPVLGLDAAWASDPATADRIMSIVAAISAALAWRERMAPRFRLTLKG